MKLYSGECLPDVIINKYTETAYVKIDVNQFDHYTKKDSLHKSKLSSKIVLQYFYLMSSAFKPLFTFISLKFTSIFKGP